VDMGSSHLSSRGTANSRRSRATGSISRKVAVHRHQAVRALGHYCRNPLQIFLSDKLCSWSPHEQADFSRAACCCCVPLLTLVDLAHAHIVPCLVPRWPAAKLSQGITHRHPACHKMTSCHRCRHNRTPCSSTFRRLPRSVAVP
jgi:hypothetical protein